MPVSDNKFSGILELTQPVWENLRFLLNRSKVGVLNKPDYDFTNLGLLFPKNDASEIAYFQAQMSHTKKLGSSVRPVVVFVQTSASTPTFKMDYRFILSGGAATGSFTTITASTFRHTYTSGSILQEAVFPLITLASEVSLGGFLDIKLYRDDNVVSGDVLAKEFNILYQRDTVGSFGEATKGRP